MLDGERDMIAALLGYRTLSPFNMNGSTVKSVLYSDASAGVSWLTLTDLVTELAGSFVLTTDPRLSDARTPTGSAGGDLAGTYPNPTIGSGKVTSTHIADGTIVNADINASAAIALSKLATDPLARANHTGTQTMSTISDAGTAATKNVPASGNASATEVVLGSDTRLSAASPTGSLVAYAGTAAPTGWLLCDGSAVSRSTYATLYGVIGTSFGSGDGSTTFNVPDLRGRVPVGLDNLGGSDAGRLDVANTLGGSGGAQTHALSTGELATHSHANTVTLSSDSAGTPAGSISSKSAGTPTGTISSNGSHNHNTFSSTSWRYRNGVASGSAFNAIQVTGTGTAFNPDTTTDGSHTHTFTGDAMTAHDHSFSGSIMATHTHTPTITNANAGSGTAHNNMQPYLLLGYIIKT